MSVPRLDTLFHRQGRACRSQKFFVVISSITSVALLASAHDQLGHVTEVGNKPEGA